MYTSFIRPHLEYASVVWGGCQAFDSEKLKKLQLQSWEKTYYYFTHKTQLRLR